MAKCVELHEISYKTANVSLCPMAKCVEVRGSGYATAGVTWYFISLQDQPVVAKKQVLQVSCLEKETHLDVSHHAISVHFVGNSSTPKNMFNLVLASF